MKLCLAYYTVKITLLSLVLLNSISTQASEVEKFMAQLNAHYQNTSNIKAFSLTQRYLGRSDPYDSWDYKAPSRYTAFKVTQFDLDRKHYTENVTHYFTGGMESDEVHFQNDTHSFRYSRNGAFYGKRVVKQSLNSFERLKNLYLMNIDFLAVRQLLSENNIKNSVFISSNTRLGLTKLTHNQESGSVIEYTFNNTPLRLISIHNKTKQRLYTYDDYQSVHGLTFARSVMKYYNGDTKPTFIKHMENFEVIEKIAPEHLKVPIGYGPIIPKNDKVLVSEEIAPNLFLLTDSGAWRNILFRTNNNEVQVFGAPTSSEQSEKTIQHITEKFPNKKITSVYVTHPHGDHIAGLGSYAKIGALIRADAYTIEAIKEYPPFSDQIHTFKFHTIEHEQSVDGVSFYVLENAHSKRQSFAFFNESGLIYQADFLQIPFDNTLTKVLPAHTGAFIDFVRSKQLPVRRIVGHHFNNNISLKVMDKASQANMM